MNEDDRIEQNIRRTAGLHALKKIGVLVEESNRDDVAKSHAVSLLLRYGWIALLFVVVLAYLMGVY